MIQHVVQSQTPLAQAARAAAYSVAAIDLDLSQQSAVELILVRYARPPVSGSFNFNQIRSKEGSPIAMWADCITDIAAEMRDITANCLADVVTDLQIVRLGAPRGFDIGRVPRQDDPNRRWVSAGPLKRANGGNEFWLNFDIDPAYVARIPLKVDNGTFIVDFSQGYALPPAAHAPLPTARYTLQQGQDGIICCPLA